MPRGWLLARQCAKPLDLAPGARRCKKRSPKRAGAQPVITINDSGLPSWASGRNLYLTAAGGASNAEVLAFTGITGPTYTIATSPPASTVVPPSLNTTTTNIPKITAFPPLQVANVARNIYLTPANRTSGQ